MLQPCTNTGGRQGIPTWQVVSWSMHKSCHSRRWSPCNDYPLYCQLSCHAIHSIGVTEDRLHYNLTCTKHAMGLPPSPKSIQLTARHPTKASSSFPSHFGGRQWRPRMFGNCHVSYCELRAKKRDVMCGIVYWAKKHFHWSSSGVLLMHFWLTPPDTFCILYTT